MTALYIILGIIAVFVILLSIRVTLNIEYTDENAELSVRWLFLKYTLLPVKEEKKKKEKKKEKKPAEKEEKQKKEEKKEGEISPIKALYEQEGSSGIYELLSRTVKLIDRFGYRFARSFIFKKLYLDMSVTGEDAADTAIKYGQWCSRIFPLFGAICSFCKVREYAVNLYPDFIAYPGVKMRFTAHISIIPRKIINSLIMFVFGVLNRLVFRLLGDLSKIKKKAPSAKVKSNDKESSDNKDNGETLNKTEEIAKDDEKNTGLKAV